MYATRTLAGVLLAGAVATGGTVVVDLVRADHVATLNAPITMGQAIKFHAPSHTVEISDNGLIEFVVGGDKRYGLTPSEAHGRGKGLFLDIESTEDKSTVKNVFGVGSEMIIKNTPLSFSKVISFTEDFLKTTPEGAKYVEVSFDLTGFNVPDGVYTERIQIQQDVWLEKSLAWDSSLGDEANDIPNGNYTDIEIEIKDGVLIKKIPVEWLQSAAYPIYTDAVFTFGTKQLEYSGASLYLATNKIADNKFVNCWADNSDAAAEGRCNIGSVSGTAVTFGGNSDFTADVEASVNNNMNACGAGSDRWVVVFSDDADADDGTARVASSTGTTINGYGTALDFEDGVQVRFVDCAYIATDKIVISYLDVPNSDFEVVACTISATYTLSCGTTAVLQLNASIINADTACEALGTDKFICIYHAADGTVGRWVRAGTVSGTTITLGTQVTVTGSATQDIGHNIISPLTDSFAITWTGTPNGTSPISFALGTVSGTTITLGATTTPLMATSTAFTSIVSVDSNSAVWMGHWGATDAATTFIAAVPIELNFSTLTFSTSSAEQIDASTDSGSLDLAKISDCKFLFAWEDDNDTNDLFAKIGDLVGCPASNHDDIIWWQ